MFGLSFPRFKSMAALQRAAEAVQKYSTMANAVVADAKLAIGPVHVDLRYQKILPSGKLSRHIDTYEMRKEERRHLIEIPLKRVGSTPFWCSLGAGCIL